MTVDTHVAQEPPPLTLRESVALVHALVDHVAREAGIRVLFIKGPFLARQGLRGDDHTSVDVDLLVSPDQAGHLGKALEVAGWRDVQAHEIHPKPLILEPHSRTYGHPRWECTVDVHDRFPGFLADPQTVFDALWRSRIAVDVAGLPLPTCDRVGNAAVAALHYLRDAVDPHRRGQFDDLVARVQVALGPAELASLSELAVTTAAVDTLRPLLERVGAPQPTVGPGPGRAWREWRLRTQTPDLTSVRWLLAARRSRPRHLPGLLWRALMPSEADIRRTHPSLGPGRLPVAWARVARLRRGLRALPAAAATLHRAGVAR